MRTVKQILEAAMDEIERNHQIKVTSIYVDRNYTPNFDKGGTIDCIVKVRVEGEVLNEGD